jgi:Secretion system C-terminal sorting domain
MNKWLKKLLLISFVFIKIDCLAQVNLVPNNSFEDTVDNFNDFVGPNTLHNWASIDSGADFFCWWAIYHIDCGPGNNGFKLPDSELFHQYPRTGRCIVDITTYDKDSAGIRLIRGVLRASLKQKLIAGQKYCAKIYVNAPPTNGYQTNGVGLYFDNGQLDSVVNIGDSSGKYWWVHPQAQCPFIINDTVNWVPFSNSFIANGTETYITIGNFVADSLLLKETVLPYVWPESEVLLDDVSLIAVNISNWLHDAYGTLSDSVKIGLPKDEVPDAKWYDINMNYIADGSEIKVKAIQPITQYIQAIDVCDRVAYDTLTVFAYPLMNNENLIVNNKMQIYPNPAKETFTVQKVYGTKVQLINMYGQVVQQQLVLNNSATFNVGALARGVYYVKGEGQVAKVVLD